MSDYMLRRLAGKNTDNPVKEVINAALHGISGYERLNICVSKDHDPDGSVNITLESESQRLSAEVGYVMIGSNLFHIAYVTRKLNYM